MSGGPYLVVSSDAHAGPSLERDLRPYCPADLLEQFDEYGAGYRQFVEAMPNLIVDQCLPPVVEAYEALCAAEGLHDPHAFLRDMDDEGITAQVVFAGGANPEPLPWTDYFNGGEPTTDPALRSAGGRIWNRWLADFVSVAPERLIGVMQIPIWDVEAAVEEVRWGAAHGLGAINFPGPRPHYPAYNSLDYEALWSVVEEVGLPLVCHVSGGERPRTGGPGDILIFSTEVQWFSRRGFGQLAFGGVFDRHPGLRVGFVEQRAAWVPEHLRELDSCYLDPRRDYAYKPDRRPSDYWRDHCFVGCSFMAHYEAELRHEVGLETMLWGSDYPHPEGTWRRTDLALRKTFAGIPEADVRAILGGNAVRIFGLDEAALRPIADRIGPRPDDVDRPLGADELPSHVGLAFREFGPFA